MERLLSPDAAQRFYDRFGARQDAQGFYEDKPLAALIRAAGFDRAGTVLEFGCGTGRFAEMLLADVLPATARYAGCDLSSEMIALARARLDRFGARAGVWHCGPEPDFSPAAPPVDRVVSTYVLDLMAPDAIAMALAAMHDALAPAGRLCCVGLTHGHGFSALTSTLWRTAHRIDPRLVGGCRPLRLAEYLDPARWRILSDETIIAWTVPSEVLVAERV